MFLDTQAQGLPTLATTKPLLRLTYESPEVQALLKVKALLADKSCWTRGTTAETLFGEPISALNPLAARWCVSGALVYVHGAAHFEGDNFWASGPGRFVNVASKVICNNNGGPVYVNDQMGHAAVMQMLDKAIELARENPSCI